ncbi:hypothetical protein QJS83_12130 [Bdellovibrio sp. 22V]|uniref:hypothetical protein n=1 Tax=Bdellovibrio TaxID=958 RepID=UPI0025434BE2|nr:hypothetical protein [Bdellovibrio sp. 22V]WII71208.1 hypothetical protein QJS83_12130 [Bdellovibrio sp. 22V]
MSRFSSLLLLCIITFSAMAEAQSGRRWGSGIDFTQRAANREKGRWSLTEWLEMKNRNRMMDMWLSMNSPSPFEFMLGGSYNSLKTEVQGTTPSETSFTSYAGQLSAYAQFVGLTGEYENNTEEHFTDTTGMLNIRLLGNSIQNTSFTIHYGLRTREYADSAQGRLSQQFGQASLQVYLTKYFGLDGSYRYFLPTSTDELGDVEGSITEAGLFIDFKAVRIFGAWYKESQKTKIPAATDDTVTDRAGIRSGLKIFF